MLRKPIQMINVCREDDTSSTRYILQLSEDDLNFMLMDENIKDRMVSVISVAGAFRKGKSFLLDFFLRYMYAKYVYKTLSDNDWLGDENEPLQGFSWRGGSQRDTTGILIWSDIFLYDYPDGEKVAIILMDTQGTFDCDSTMKDCANVFALSTMISSVQIFNIQSNIQNDDLQHLQLFTEYARIAMENTGKKPFQKLQFLIRDWPYKWEAPFGAIGGKQILETILNSKDKRQEENEQLCENVKTSFDVIDCYLMPHPGYAIEDPNFRGCLKDLRDEFKKHLLDFIPLILAPENIIIKEISGQKLKVAHLLHYIRLYFESFNSKEFPEPTTIFEATAEANNQIHATNAEELYMNKMRALTNPETPYIDEKELNKKHEKYAEEALESFEGKLKLGREISFKKYSQKIKNYISSNLEQFTKINEAKLALIELNCLNDLNRCITAFENHMDDLLIQDAHTPPNEFNISMESVKLETLQKFDSNRWNSTKQIYKRIRKQLEEAIDKHCVKYKNQNEIKWELTKYNITLECAEAKKLYKELMNNSEHSIEALNAAHADAKDRALESFHKSPQVGAESVFNECENQLITYIDEVFNSFKERSVNKQQNLQLHLSKLKMNYQSLMKEACISLLTNDNLLSKHEEFKGKTLEEFDGLPNKSDAKNYMDERRQLDEEIEEFYEYYKLKNDKCMLEFVQKCVSSKAKAKKVLLESLEKLGVLASVDDVRSNYYRVFKVACDLYTKLKDSQYFNQEIYEKYLSELKKEAEAECERYLKRTEAMQELKKLASALFLMVTAVGFVLVFKAPPPF